ncbi:MAG TPA: hypothetical protein VD926_02395 [Acidimicrobiales bacterium]|nr:hypothetical protein [Acidimicrobiales bacterium]
MRRLPLRVLIPLLGLLVLSGACSSSGDDGSAGTTVAIPSTSLEPSQTTTTLGPRIPTEIDVCELLQPDELETVLEDAGPGEVGVTTPPVEEGEVPPLLTGQCAWPDATEPAFTLYYLAPTTAASGPAHLQDVASLDPAFARDATISQTEQGNQQVGLLVDGDGRLREVAVVARSALLFLVVDVEVEATDTRTVDRYARLVVDALIRAPR